MRPLVAILVALALAAGLRAGAPDVPPVPDVPPIPAALSAPRCLECGPDCGCGQGCDCGLAAQKSVKQKAAPCFHCGQSCDCVNCGCDAYYNAKIESQQVTAAPRSISYTPPAFAAPAPAPRAVVQPTSRPQPVQQQFRPAPQPVRQQQFVSLPAYQPAPARPPVRQPQPAYQPRPMFFAGTACAPGRG